MMIDLTKYSQFNLYFHGISFRRDVFSEKFISRNFDPRRERNI